MAGRWVCALLPDHFGDTPHHDDTKALLSKKLVNTSHSAAGTRTRVTWVDSKYIDHIDVLQKSLCERQDMLAGKVPGAVQVTPNLKLRYHSPYLPHGRLLEEEGALRYHEGDRRQP